MIKLTDILNEDCWKGYKQIGMKTKGGKQVPNCVPESKEVSEYSGGSYEYNSSDPYAQYNGNEKKVNEVSMTVSIANIVKDLFPKEFFQVYKKNDVERVKSAITDLVKTLNRYYKQHNINVRFVDSNIKMKMYAKENKSMNEIGVFNIHSYTKGILPPGYMDTTTPQKKEKYRSTVRDLMQTLNSFWKRNNIPFRVRK